MKIGLYNIAILILLKSSYLFGQSELQNFTISVIDTSKSQTEQAEEIFNWVSTNISYDIKSLKKGEYPNLSPMQLIRKGKGLCKDYSNLVEAMCNSIGIEAYTIFGYSKGYLYNKEKPFLRSNHSWNVIYADSAWIHLDATWGSGYLDKKPHIHEKILNTIARVPYAKSKLFFTKENSSDYFNIPVDTLLKTHYPLDPKWLFNSNPENFYTFQNDSFYAPISYPYYAEEIEKIRGKNFETQRVAEGKNGVQYNKFNYFDLANGYFVRTINYDLERDITENNLWQFEKYLNEYTTITEAIDKYKTISDSVYRTRTKQLRVVARDQKKLSGRIKSKAKKAQKTHKSSQKQIVGKNSSYRKKMNGYQMNIGRSEIKKISIILENELEYTDTAEYELLVKEITNIKSQQPILDKKLDSLIGIVDNYSFKDAQIDDSIAAANKEFKTSIDILWTMILIGDEAIIVDYVDSLKHIYSDIENFLSDKKEAKSDLQNTGRAFYSYSVLLQKSLKQEMTLNSKLQKITNNADSVIKAHNQNIDELIACYKKSMVFTKKLANHNELQSDVRQANLTALKEQKKSINKENKFFVTWYENHVEQEKNEYLRDKLIIKNIKSTAIKNQKTVEMKLKKHNS